mgnify:CR=1 FL=1
MKNLLITLLLYLVPLVAHSQEPCMDPYYSEVQITNYISTKSRDLITLEIYVPALLEHYKDGNTVVILDSYMGGTNILIIEEMVQFTQIGGNLLISPKDGGLQLAGFVKDNNKLIITYKK